MLGKLNRSSWKVLPNAWRTLHFRGVFSLIVVLFSTLCSGNLLLNYISSSLFTHCVLLQCKQVILNMHDTVKSSWTKLRSDVQQGNFPYHLSVGDRCSHHHSSPRKQNEVLFVHKLNTEWVFWAVLLTLMLWNPVWNPHKSIFNGRCVPFWCISRANCSECLCKMNAGPILQGVYLLLRFFRPLLQCTKYKEFKLWILYI